MNFAMSGCGVVLLDWAMHLYMQFIVDCSLHVIAVPCTIVHVCIVNLRCMKNSCMGRS